MYKLKDFCEMNLFNDTRCAWCAVRRKNIKIIYRKACISQVFFCTFVLSIRDKDLRPGQGANSESLRRK